MSLRTFQLNRIEDESGVSGTGVVAVGVLLPTGRVVLEWTTDTKSIAIYESIKDVEDIHGHGGKTLIQWLPRCETCQRGVGPFDLICRHGRVVSEIQHEHKCKCCGNEAYSYVSDSPYATRIWLDVCASCHPGWMGP